METLIQSNHKINPQDIEPKKILLIFSLLALQNQEQQRYLRLLADTLEFLFPSAKSVDIFLA